jgi:hypothetical protein
MLRDYLRISGRHRLLVPVRIPGASAVRAGGLLLPAFSEVPAKVRLTARVCMPDMR